ncbi:unnamed protein product, partial [Sphacelaria rigidula]
HVKSCHLQNFPSYHSSNSSPGILDENDRENAPLCTRMGMNANSRNWANMVTDVPLSFLAAVGFALGRWFCGAPWGVSVYACSTMLCPELWPLGFITSIVS